MEVKRYDFNKVSAFIKSMDEIIFESNKDLEWYRRRYGNKAVCYMAMRNGSFECIGYAIVVGLTSETFDAMRAGVLTNDASIREECFVDAQTSAFKYIAAIAVVEKFRSIGIATDLVKAACKESGDYIALNCHKARKVFELNEFETKDYSENCSVAYLSRD